MLLPEKAITLQRSTEVLGLYFLFHHPECGSHEYVVETSAPSCTPSALCGPLPPLHCRSQGHPQGVGSECLSIRRVLTSGITGSAFLI